MLSTYPVLIFAHMDTSVMKDPESYFINYPNINVLNPLYVNTSVNVQKTEITSSSKLSITSNGIDGIGYTDTTFNIDSIKFNNCDIHFVVRLKTNDNLPIKCLPLIQLNTLDLKLLDSTGSEISANFYSSFGDLSGEQYGGFFKGYLNTGLTGLDVKIRAIYNSTVSLTGYSNTFNIYPDTGIYDIRKINENIDQESQFESLTFQQILQDNNSFFKDFLGQIVGNSTSDPNTLGIEVYEKISNFVSNNSDIIYSNLNQFMSMLDNINVEYDKHNIQYPPSLQRLVDIFSIPLSYQRGGKNKYSFNFNDKGYTNSNKYGLNKGSKIDFSTGILYRNINPSYYKSIVIHEKFSNTYFIASPLIPDARNIVYLDNTLKSYSLSAYNADWGWGLVLPNDYTNDDIPKYYDFYEYVDVVDNSLLQKFIDLDNTNNSYLNDYTSFSQYAGKGGIIDNILIHTLYSNTDIISSNK